MQLRPVSENHHDVLVRHEQSLNSTIKRYRSAVEQLVRAFFDQRPVAIVVGDGRLGPAHVLAKFLELAGEDAEVVTISGTCMNATEFMRQIVRSIGFDPEPLSLNDLESVLDLFLQHQRKTRHRTIISVQDFDAHGWWVLDKIRRLIECEAEDRNGLMMLLSGPPSVNVVLNEPVLDIIADHAGERIVIKPFTLSETRDFVRNHVMSSMMTGNSRSDINEVLDFNATNIIHESCHGIPDDLYRICNKCLELLAASDDKRITIDLAKEAVAEVGLGGPLNGSSAATVAASGITDLEAPGHLVVEIKGEATQEIPLGDCSIVIGRDRLCDHVIVGLRVSRFHSIFSLTDEGLVVADLGSTNGTLVNGKKIERYTLDEEDVVGIGQARIRYVPGAGERLAQAMRINEARQRCEEDTFQESSVNFVGETFKLISTS